MKVLLTGGRGMLGRTLSKKLEGYSLFVNDIDEFDIARHEEVRRAFGRVNPDVVVHCAAMTAVDQCESAIEQAMRVNAIGTTNVAINTCLQGARLIAISTDYVFSGDLDRPYNEWDRVDPKSVYGRSKWAAEEAVRSHCPNHAIVRIAWLYGSGGPSFFHTMTQLGVAVGDPLKVVDDQVGNPTSVDVLVPVLQALIENPVVGTFHATCEGEASWYDFAKEIFRLRRLEREVVPCRTEDFPRPAPRPSNSRLDNMALRLHSLPKMPHWQEALESFVKEYPNG